MGEWWDLWCAWWSGRQVNQAQLAGWPVSYWGRLGKILQFAAGLTVLLDLIGSEPLRAFGKRLMRVPWARGLSRTSEVVALFVFVISLVAYVVLFVLVFVADFVPSVRDLFPAPPPGGRDRDIGLLGYIAMVAGVIVFFALAMLTHWIIYERGGDVPRKTKAQLKDEMSNALFLVPVVVVTALVAGAILLPWLLFIYAFCVPLSRGLAWLLDRAKPAHPLRWIAVLLFVIGFHFDLLAS